MRNVLSGLTHDNTFECAWQSVHVRVNACVCLPFRVVECTCSCKDVRVRDGVLSRVYIFVSGSACARLSVHVRVRTCVGVPGYTLAFQGMLARN